MKTTTKWIFGALGTACLIFALSPGPEHLIANPTRWEVREQFVYLTGLSTMSLMVLSMVISVRLPLINHWMRGLDKAYIVHKWTGIVSTILVVLHWLAEKAPKWLVEWGVIPNPGELTDGSGFSDLEIDLFQSGVFLVEWVFYGLIILVIIALSTKIPYHIFRKSHKLFPGIFLIAAYHGATAQLKERWLTTPAGYLLLILLAVGVIAALIGLFQQIGASRKVTAVIQQIEQHDHGILGIRLTMQQTFASATTGRGQSIIYQPGQYAFLTFSHDSEPHPFTIASSGDDPNQLSFAIKELGSFTTNLAHRLQIGQPVNVEGPYGEFTFDSPGKRQVWVAGGIGITPFLARLDYLVRHGGTSQSIDFWYSTRSDQDTLFPASLAPLCQRSGVNFYHLNSTKNEYLTVDLIQSVVGSFEDVSIWFCGPPAFAQCLLKGLDAYGFDKRRFHYDDFSMR
ncbi:iron reductase [Spirosoma sp. HMF4905]|uniref:Iron reductase n=1 Tax=Spirosoma arboris TaxID=2682092 RepID=A0A7K1SLU8_9BACT|nr:ferric reductase-like transmembrane domain-containing protein [Spirosoma arboris]MVM34780.1 iron reductase [Spirosoma arboris]